jgi:hypothetical protein
VGYKLTHDDFRRAHSDYRRPYDDFRTVFVMAVVVSTAPSIGNETSGGGHEGKDGGK